MDVTLKVFESNLFHDTVTVRYSEFVNSLPYSRKLVLLKLYTKQKMRIYTEVENTEQKKGGLGGHEHIFLWIDEGDRLFLTREWVKSPMALKIFLSGSF